MSPTEVEISCLVSTSSRSRQNGSFAGIAGATTRIGGRICGLARYRMLTDREPLALDLPLREAQDIIALEAGYTNWAALKVAVADEPMQTKAISPTPRLTRAVPVIFVANVKTSAEFSGALSVSPSISCMGNHRSTALCRATVLVYISNSCTVAQYPPCRPRI